MKNTMFKAIASLACAAVLVACGGAANTTTTTPPPPQPVFTATDTALGSGGKAVATGDIVTVQYTGYLYDESKPSKHADTAFETTSTGAPIAFTVGVGSRITGIDQGVIGMKVGGKRTLLIPANMAWGPSGRADASGNVLVPPNTAVVYEIEVFAISTPPLSLFSKVDTVTGTGTVAAASNLVSIKYTGYLYDETKADKKGAQFDASPNGVPFSFLLGVNSRIGGWEMGIPGMQIGGKRTLFIPSGLAYAQWGLKDSAGNYLVQPNTPVVYDVELTAVNTSPPASTVQPDYQKIDVQVGTVGNAAVTGNTVLVQYSGYLYNDSVTDKRGLRFDTSRTTGTPISVKLGDGKVIKGWEDGLLGMKAGGRRTLIIPASMGYGSTAQTNIPANSALIFDVEVVSVTP